MQRAVSRLEERGSGILLLHDVKKVTAGLLPELFKRLKERGFKLVHMVAKEGAYPDIPPPPPPTAEEIAAKEKAEKRKLAGAEQPSERRVRHVARIHRVSHARQRQAKRHYTHRVGRYRSSSYNDFIYDN